MSINTTPSKILKVANATTVFGINISVGTEIINTSNGDTFIVLDPIANTESLTTCIAAESVMRVLNTSNIVQTIAENVLINAPSEDAVFKALTLKQNNLTFGIADTNTVRIDSASVTDGEYAKFTANGLESRSVSELLSDIGAQPAGSYEVTSNKVTSISVNSTDVQYPSAKLLYDQLVLKQDVSTAVTQTNANTVDYSLVATDGTTGRKIRQGLATTNSDGDINIPSGRTYKINNLSILNSNLVSGSAGTAGYLFTGNGTTTAPSWSTPLTAIGSSLTQNYLTKTGATKLENSSIYESDGLVGINTTTLTNRFTVNGTSRFIGTLNLRAADENFTEFQSRIYSNTTWHGQFNSTYRARGTEASPLAVVSGNGVMHYDQLAYDGSNFIRGSQFRSYVDGTVATGITPIGWEWLTMNTSGVYASRLRIRSSGVMEIGNNVAIGTTDLDGTPPIGRLTVKGSTNNGTSNIFVGRDSDEVNVFSVDTDGDIITSGTITASSATTNTEVINLGQLKDKVKSGSISMVAGTWPIYFEKSFPTAGYVTSVWGINSLGVEVQIKIITQYDYGFEIEVPEDCIVKYDCTYPETIITPENNQWYGIEYDVTNSSATLTRIGNLSLHVKLPVQNKMKACLLSDTITVNYYLSPTDWTKKIDGVTASVLDGTDGQVMIEKPVIYWKFETEGNINRVKISEYPLAGFSQKPKCYIGAYEAALQRSNSKLASVVNTTTDFRGGNNTSAWDAASNSLLGKPATNYHIVNARTYARNRGTGWNQLIYDNYMELFWLFAIEYATFNSQLAVNNTLTAQGYKQGGLGNGVTTANNSEWVNFNGQNPFINCGASNSLASGSGEVSVNVTDFGGTGVTRTFTVNRYRGLENPFGHIWKFADGLNVYNSSGTTTMYVIDNPSNLASDTSTNSRTAGVIAQVGGYGKTMLFGSSGDIIPNVITGEITPTTYMCDYFYPNLTANSWRIPLFGGAAVNGSDAGFLFSYFNGSSSSTRTFIGSRLSAR